MRLEQKRKLKKQALLAALLLFLTGSAFSSADTARAAESDTEETITFRVLATGDLHGQVTSYNYETGERDELVGLSKIATLIRKERNAVGTGNTLLVDAGDCLYDYSTNYIYDNHPELTQPIYQAMLQLRYDCITLGNHDFDYPWDYLYEQLDSSGLLSKTIVSNAVYTETGESPFRTSAIYTKNAVTSEGRKIALKIGVIGATKSSFSTRRYRYGGFLDGLDIYKSVKAEAEALKEQGADFIVVFIHGGLGLLSGSDTTVQAGARIAKLSAVDAVVCSHSHETFPSSTGVYSSFANVDETAGTIYGTPVVETGSHASNLGVIEFTLAVGEEDAITVQSGTSAIKSVKASTAENQDIVDLFSPYLEELLNSYDTTEYPIADGLTLTNTDCVIQDSNLYQLMNDAKMRYASSYVNEYLPEYKDYPIVAATLNRLDSKAQTIELSGSLTETDIAAIMAESSGERSSGYIHLYTLSGENLWEWLEFNASMYGRVGTSLPDLLSDYAAKHPTVSSLLRSSNVKNQNSFFAFDGVSYDIDLSIAPRYNINGNLINYTHRVKNLTWQGQPVTTDMTFIVVMDSVETSYKFMPVSANSLFTVREWTTSKDVLMDYIKNESIFGPISVAADQNWHLLVPDDYKFILAVPKVDQNYVTAQSWYQKRVKKGSIYYYYLGTVVQQAQSLHAVLSPDITHTTNRKIPVTVLASTAPDAAITEILYLAGNVQSVKNSRWAKDGKLVTENSFLATKNGRYSVRVTDSLGNMVIVHLNVDNYDKQTLEVPIVNRPTNRIEYISGTAIAGSTIHIAMPDGTLISGKTASDGTFKIEIPLPRANDFYTVWATKGSATSPVVETTAKKTGANRPTANPLLPGSTLVTGTVDPYVTLSIRIGSRVYVAVGEKEAYQNSSVYKKSHKLTETEITIAEDGSFTIVLPAEAVSGTTYYLYATDRNGNASRAVSVIVP